MPYILKKTNGVTLTTVNDASLDITTNLTFVGRNYSGYGQPIDQNFLYLLENFASSTAPTKPIQGQLWFNNSTHQLNLNYDGKNFIGLASLSVTPTAPTVTNEGTLWWDSVNKQLYACDGSQYTIIGPQQSGVANWQAVREPGQGIDLPVPILKGVIGNSTVAVLSNSDFNTDPTLSTLNSTFPVIQQGLTIANADAATGISASSTSSGYMVWGTAAHSLLATNATTASSVAITNATTVNATYYLALSSTYGNSSVISADSDLSFNPSTNTMGSSSIVFSGAASAAKYADLAERYEADAVYEVGTVLVIGGEKEVTVTTQFADTRVAGIVSKNPAYMMNSEAGSDETHPYIALKGRVPCKVQGYVKKGDLIVTSSTAGYGIAANSVFGGAIIGKALGNQSGGFGVVEVLVV